MCVIQLELSGNNKSKQNWFWPLWLWSLTSDFDLLHGHHFCHWYGSWKFHDGTITATLPLGRIVPVRELTGLSGLNRLISSLFNHIKLHLPWNEVGRELVPRYTPTKSGRDPRRIALTDLSDHNNLISSLSTHLMNYISHERNRLRCCPKVHTALPCGTTIREELHPRER